jgi:hypothetical protein
MEPNLAEMIVRKKRLRLICTYHVGGIRRDYKIRGKLGKSFFLFRLKNHYKNAAIFVMQHYYDMWN